MNEYPIYETVAFTIEQKQNEWIIQQANKRLLNKSIIIREAIELLKKEYENGNIMFSPSTKRPIGDN